MAGELWETSLLFSLGRAWYYSSFLEVDEICFDIHLCFPTSEDLYISFSEHTVQLPAEVRALGVWYNSA